MDFLQSKKIIWAFALIGVVAVLVVIVAGLMHRRNATTPTTAKNVADFNVSRKDIPQTTLPDTFPADIPLEKDAKVIQNYTATTSTGGFQATREFETTKTLADSYKIYKTFFQQNGWQLNGGTDDTYVKVISANKSNLTATVTMDYNLKTEIKTIEITITQAAK